MEQCFDLKAWKEAKDRANMTFEELSKTSGVKISGLKDIFNGVTKDPRISSVYKIEQALGIMNYKEAPKYSQEENRLVDIFKKLSSGKQKTLLELAEDLLKAERNSAYTNKQIDKRS